MNHKQIKDGITIIFTANNFPTALFVLVRTIAKLEGERQTTSVPRIPELQGQGQNRKAYEEPIQPSCLRNIKTKGNQNEAENISAAQETI